MDNERMQVALMTGFTGYIRRYAYGKKMRIWETCTILAEKEFNKLKDQADYNKKVNPLKFLAKMVSAICTGAMAATFISVMMLRFL